MRIFSTKPLAVSLAVSAALFAASPATAEMMKLSATLEAAQEVPPNDSAGKGTAEVTFDSDSQKLDWTIEYSGLTGEATAAHFHGPAAKGENAGVAVPIEDTKSGASGTSTLTDAQAADLVAGRLYINIHTAAHPDGEIRGQVEKAM